MKKRTIPTVLLGLLAFFVVVYLTGGIVGLLLLLFLALAALAIAFIIQYHRTGGAFLTGDFGISFRKKTSPRDKKETATPPTPDMRMDYIDSMGSIDFGRYVADLLLHVGFFQVEVTSEDGEFGGVITAHRDMYRFVFLCRQSAVPLEPEALREVLEATDYFAADKAICITNAAFSEDASTLALRSNVALWGREELVQLMRGQLPFLGEVSRRNASALLLPSVPGLDFCYAVAQALQRAEYGYVAVMKGANDHGADIIAKRNDNQYVFKCLEEKTGVNLGIVETLQGAMEYYGAQRGIIVKDGSFGERERDFGRTQNIALWDMDYLNTL